MPIVTPLEPVVGENESKEDVGEAKSSCVSEDIEKPRWWDAQGLETILEDPKTGGFVPINRHTTLSEIQLAAMSLALQKQALGDHLNTLLEGAQVVRDRSICVLDVC